MMLFSYIKDKITALIIHLSGSCLASFYLYAIGLTTSQIVILLVGWLIVLISYLIIDYRVIKNRYDKWLKAFDALDKKYLIAELIQKPSHYPESLFYEFLRKANKSMMEEINQYKRKEKEYEEYIEQWVHEMKTPLSAISLVCTNNTSQYSKKIEGELKKINNLVLQTMYYAKSEFIHKDLFINHVDLNEIIHSVILENKWLLQEKRFHILIDENLPTIRSDKKFLTYIINQIVLNSIKYANKETPSLRVGATIKHNQVNLTIEDNGIGIRPSDLPRVFDKGFTGHNRTNQHSTGIGLYLCKNLCGNLNIDLSIESEENIFTRVSLLFQLTNL
jgi:signal transduction histidine kinase